MESFATLVRKKEVLQNGIRSCWRGFTKWMRREVLQHELGGVI
jgi:hypothetical protein